MSDYYGTDGDDAIDQAALGLPDWTLIRGGAGNDHITIGIATALGGPGNDTIVGTSPWSTALYWDAGAVDVNLATGVVKDGWGGTDTLQNIHTVHLSSNNDTALGSAGDDTFWELGGSNTIDGGGGNDTVVYWQGTVAEANITYDAATRAFTVDKHFAGQGNGTGVDTLRNVETIQFADGSGTTATLSAADFTGPMRPQPSVAIPGGASIQQLLEGDFNGDGIADLWIDRLDGGTIGDTATAAQVVLGDGRGGFTDATASVFAGGVVPSFHYPARIGGADFNGDGITDVFVPDFGPDHAPWTGGQNRVFVSAAGRLTDQSAQLEQRLTQGHGLSIGDIDGNGSPDVLVNALNDPSGRADEVVFSDGHGGFTTSASLFPSVVQVTGTASSGNTWSYTGDLNGDGLADVVLGTWDARGGPSQLLLASAPGTFPAAGVHALPDSGVERPVVLAITPVDLNGDALPDLVLSVTNGGDFSTFYQTPYLQFLLNAGGGNFTDITASVYAQDPAARPGYWYKFVEAVDFNGDGAGDILAVTDVATHSADLLLNDGHGAFHVARSFVGYAQVHAMDVDGDGVPEIVAAANAGLTVYRNDIFTGNALGKVFHPDARPDSIAGGAGIDTAVYAAGRAAYQVAHTGAAWTVAANAHDVDSLSGVERLAFADGRLALDLDGHAGTVAKYLGVVFGADAVHNAGYVGIGLSWLDAGTSVDEVMSQALQVRFGSASNAQVVAAMFENVTGVAPSATQLDDYTQLLDSSTFSRVGLAQMAADTGANLAHIGFVGLQQSGLAYS
jgi:hypothetical protein